MGPLGAVSNLHQMDFHNTYTLNRFLFFLLKSVHVYGDLKPRRTTMPKLVPSRETKITSSQITNFKQADH